MADVVITVNGLAEEFHPPQRATLSVQVGFQSAGKQEARMATVALADRVSASILALHDEAAGPLTWYARQAIATWSSRPWHAEGGQLPLVHHAGIGFELKFADFAALAGWADEWAGVDGVTLAGVRWALTAAAEREVVDRVRASAVRAARDKAQAYADSLGLGPVRPLAVADVGLLGEHPGASPRVEVMAAAARSLSPQDPQTPALVPEDLRIAAAVDARFATRPA